MPSIKRRVANVLEKLSGNLIIPMSEVTVLAERLHLRRLFEHLGVDCVFDVGANNGQYARMLRQAVGYRGPIISYEPIPELAQAMARRAAMGDGAWHVEGLALDREAGPATFHIAASDQFSSLRSPAADQPALFATDNRVAREVEVQRSTLAAELARWQDRLRFKRPFLKMDTQGNDIAVVDGAGASLAAFVGMQTELAIRRLYAGTPTAGEALDHLRSLGFEPSAFVPNNDGHFPDLYEIDCILYNARTAAT